ncbi:MAG: 8-oxo-dGTP diphosphatase [Elusimicrobia bacterium]|nr:8-oxo-dGTP diphosphatase [Elusimicrobiota bacterium]
MKLATLCYLRRKNKTLMLHRIKKKNDIHDGKWNGLGGKFEEGESPEECARREVFEEAGIKINKLRFKGVLTFPEFSKGEDWYVFLFVSSDFTGKLKNCVEGNLKWIEDLKLLKLNLWQGDKIFLKHLNKKGFISGKFKYKNGKLADYKLHIYK